MSFILMHMWQALVYQLSRILITLPGGLLHISNLHIMMLWTFA